MAWNNQHQLAQSNTIRLLPILHPPVLVLQLALLELAQVSLRKCVDDRLKATNQQFDVIVLTCEHDVSSSVYTVYVVQLAVRSS